MEISRNDFQADDFVSGKLSQEESLLAEARILVDPVFRLHVLLQKRIYRLVKLYARKSLRNEIGVMHDKLFRDPDKKVFRHSIEQLFNR